MTSSIYFLLKNDKNERKKHWKSLSLSSSITQNNGLKIKTKK